MATSRIREDLPQLSPLVEVPANRAGIVRCINRHSSERVYHVIRRCLARDCELHSPLGVEVECEESYFGGRRKGPRGRGAAGKVSVFGLLKRNGKVYTRIVEDLSRRRLLTGRRKGVDRLLPGL